MFYQHWYVAGHDPAEEKVWGFARAFKKAKYLYNKTGSCSVACRCPLCPPWGRDYLFIADGHVIVNMNPWKWAQFHQANENKKNNIGFLIRAPIKNLRVKGLR